MRELTLFEDTIILTMNGPQKAVDAKYAPILDGFGNIMRVSGVEASGEARAVLVQLKDHGDPFVLPETAKVRPRTPEDATYAPVLATDLRTADHFFLMPNRKLRLNSIDPETPMPPLPAETLAVAATNSADHLCWLLQFLEHVEPNSPEHPFQGLVLKFDTIHDARLGGELLGMYGVKVARHKARPWVYPDQRRPSCVVAKLLSGVMHGDAAGEVLFEFYGKGILHPVAPVNDALITECQVLGTLLEGQPVENLVRLHHVKVSERKRPTVTLTLSHDALIETVWAQI